jgi:colanic acid/amylovoran biosynthesis glycosyltransferase
VSEPLPESSDRKPNSFKVAVCLNDPSTYSETFVKRHVDRLCNGRTVVVSRAQGCSYPGHPSCSLRGRSMRDKLISLLGRLSESVRNSDPLIEFFRAHQVRFVLAEFGPLGVAAYRSANAARLPMFCYFRGYDASKLLRNPKYVSDVQEMCRSIDGIVAVSRSLLNNLAAAGISCRQEFVIPSGVDTIEFVPDKKRPGSYLAVGRFVEKKAPRITVSSFARVLADNPDLSLDMVGDGPELEPCRVLCARLGVSDRIRLHGAIDHAAVKRLMKTSAYFLQHSVTAWDGDTEGMPSAIQEAMSCGCVVIATRHAGIPEHIQHNITGVLVDEHDERQYAAEILRLIKDPELSEAIARNARAYAMQHLDYRVLQARLEMLIEGEIARAR